MGYRSKAAPRHNPRVYTPEHFKVEDPAVLANVMRRYSFATVLCVVDDEILATHLPLVLDEARNSLYGHFAKANDHWRAFEHQRKALIIFQGAHAYVSSSIYATTPNVPTWAYVAVHAHGTPRLLKDEEATDQMIAMVEYFDPELHATHPETTGREFVSKKARGIVAFEMPIEKLEGKFKVGQNKGDADRRKAGEELLKSDDPITRVIGQLYLRELG